MKKINIIVLLLGIFGFHSSSVADTPPGLTFEVTSTGSGATAALGQRATLHYIGKLEDVRYSIVHAIGGNHFLSH